MMNILQKMEQQLRTEVKSSKERMKMDLTTALSKTKGSREQLKVA